MTLLGKIFRPWDLSSSESLESKSSDNQLNSGDIAEHSKPRNRDSNNDAGVITAGKCTPPSEGSSESEKRVRERRPGFIKTPVDLEESAKGLQQYMEIAHANAAYYLPSSPVTPTSSNFLSSSSINELASLSRGELTAMGLLPPEPPASMKVKRQRPKRFRCPHCQVAFSNNGQLRGHIRIHTGERPFACEHEGCGKSFTRNEELTRHRRIHTGLRPYPCTHCGKKFGRKDHLKKHTRTHQRPMYNASSGMIGLGNPFHPFNPSLLQSHAAINEFGSVTSPYALPFMLSIPPPISHFPFS